ncbi:hypothetical protein IWW50_000789 [Coemansia erecta]|nr:hypothetical protein IWW50_000789 [Coemansia erecta]
MITLASLVSEYGDSVDKALIAAIWNEQSEDTVRCRDIVHMISAHTSPGDSSMSAGADGSETVSIGCSEPLSASSARTDSTSSSRTSRPEPRTHAAESAASVEAITSPQALVEFLAACFPECGSDYLSTKVREIFGAQDTEPFQVDPIEAIDIVSNAFYNDIEAVETQQYRQSHGATSPKAGKADTSALSLAAIEAQYSVAGAKGKGRKRSKGRGRGKALPAALRRASAQPASDSNAWNAINTEVGSLCSIFPMLSVSAVTSTYHACGAHIGNAVERLSELAEKSSPPRANSNPGRDSQDAHKDAVRALPPLQKKQMRATVGMLQALFADIPVALLERAALETHDADAAAERVLVLKEEEDAKEQAAADSAKSGKNVKWKPAEDLARYRVGAPVARAQGGRDDVVYDVMQRVPLSDISGDAREWIAANPRGAEYCRKRAAAYTERRNELYTQAAHAYTRRKSLHHSGATALYYSTEGHKHDAQARVWRMRAAQASVAAMRRKNINIVDLHGLTRAEAVAVVDDAVATWYAGARAADTPSFRTRSLHIVTGLGNHSIGGRACIHPSVLRLLRNGNWRFEEGDGYIDVVGAGRGGPLVD